MVRPKTEKNTKNKVSKTAWSFSKRELLFQCNRKYYYQYFGSNKKVAKEEPHKLKLIELKKLSSKHLMVGFIIHLLISTYFKKMKEEQLWTKQRLLDWGYSLIEDSISFSESFKNGISEEKKYPPHILMEIIYNLETKEEIREFARSKINITIENLFHSEIFNQLKIGAMNPESLIEVKSNYDLNNLIRVDGKIDLAFGNGDYFTIADWKTGKVEFQDTSLQLLTYTHWAIEKKNINQYLRQLQI